MAQLNICTKQNNSKKVDGVADEKRYTKLCKKGSFKVMQNSDKMLDRGRGFTFI